MPAIVGPNSGAGRGASSYFNKNAGPMGSSGGIGSAGGLPSIGGKNVIG